MAEKFENLSTFLKQKRLDAGLSRAELASAIGGVHAQFVTNWELGLCAPPSHKYKKLIEVLDIDREELVSIMVEDSKASIMERVYKNRKATSTKKNSSA